MDGPKPAGMIGSVAVGRPVGGSITVFVAGEQDQSNVAALRSALTLAAALADHVVVDLAAATFVSAALVGAVSWAEVSLRGRGGRLTVRSLSPMARRVFELSSLDGLIAELRIEPGRPCARRPGAERWRGTATACGAPPGSLRAGRVASFGPDGRSAVALCRPDASTS